jgi:hypothetical protein
MLSIAQCHPANVGWLALVEHHRGEAERAANALDKVVELAEALQKIRDRGLGGARRGERDDLDAGAPLGATAAEVREGPRSVRLDHHVHEEGALALFEAGVPMPPGEQFGEPSRDRAGLRVPGLLAGVGHGQQRRPVPVPRRSSEAAQVAVLPGNGAEVAHLVVATGPSLPRDRFGLVVADEARHVKAGTWKWVLDRFRPVFALGATATPVGLDREVVEDLFGGVIYEYLPDEALNDGAAVPPQQRGAFTDAGPAGRGRKKRAGTRTGRGTRSGCRSN